MTGSSRAHSSLAHEEHDVSEVRSLHNFTGFSWDECDIKSNSMMGLISMTADLPESVMERDMGTLD